MLWIRTLTIVAGVALLLAVIDLAVRLAEPFSHIRTDVVDIQSPSVLRAKLAAFEQFDGVRVALLGDSVPYGRTMAAYGDREWRQHTLDRVLESELEQRLQRPVLVSNFGMNGAVPVDVTTVADAALDAGANLLVVDVTLRSFSADFAEADQLYSRPWLADFAARGRSWAERVWLTYDLREYFQWRVLGGSPRAVAEGAVRAANMRLLSQDDAEDPLLLALRARERYSSIALGASHPQLRATYAMLDAAAARGVPVLMFYSTENPRLIDQIIEPERRERLLREFETLLAGPPGEMVYLPPLTSLDPERFLDQVHLDAEGYRQLAAALTDRATPLLAASADAAAD